MIINGVELDFNMYNVAHVKRYKEGREKAAKICEKIENTDMTNISWDAYIETLTTGCNAIFELFDSTFGDGTSNALFGGETDFRACLKALEEFDAAVVEDTSTTAKRAHVYMPVEQQPATPENGPGAQAAPVPANFKPVVLQSSE